MRDALLRNWAISNYLNKIFQSVQFRAGVLGVMLYFAPFYKISWGVFLDFLWVLHHFEFNAGP